MGLTIIQGRDFEPPDDVDEAPLIAVVSESMAARVFEQECVIYPEAVSLFAAGRLRVEGKQVEIVDAQ